MKAGKAGNSEMVIRQEGTSALFLIGYSLFFTRAEPKVLYTPSNIEEYVEKIGGEKEKK